MSADRDFLLSSLEKWDLRLDGTACDKICRYLHMLSEKNKVMDLTAVTDLREMVTRHIMDSLVFLKYGLIDGGAMLDVGSGAGLPGIPIACATEMGVTLLDSQKKRCAFLEEVRAALSLDNVRVVCGRGEEQPKTPSYDIVTARAVTNLRVLAEICLPLTAVGGLFIPMKGGDVEGELSEAKNAIAMLGGRTERIIKYQVPESGVTRSLPVIRKESATPAKFPRRYAQIVKNPL